MSMHRDPADAPRSRRLRRLGAPGAIVIALSLVVGGATAGCTGHDAAATPDGATAPGAPAAATDPAVATTPAAVAEAPVPLGHMHMPTADEVTATWKARPDYVAALPDAWQAAYAYALARPDVLQWLPCYCGCVGMGHRSNLDCFFQRREVEGFYAYEEHASYCDICVETANLAQQLLREGSTIVAVRAAVDARFGGTAPGQDIPLPPLS
ncbi:MAG: PCYCGC motif-containing (lipo)protein [Chloroflexota bacterium]